MTTASTTIFVLGAIDPEMLTISRVLTAAGLPWRWARLPGTDGATPIRQPGAAYQCENVAAAGGGVARVWVECRPAGTDRAALEARGDVVIDHHDVRVDPMATAAPARAVEASSIGQLWELASRRPGLSGLRDAMAGPRRIDPCPACQGYAPAEPCEVCQGTGTQECPALHPDLRIEGAIDHCLFAALGGLVPGVGAFDALYARAAIATDRELAALKGTPPEAPSMTAYLDAVEAAARTLRAAPRLTLGGVEVCDLLDHVLPIPSLPVAAAYAVLAYVTEVPARPGVPTTCSIGGAASPEAVEAFAEIGRAAFAGALVRARRDAERQAEALAETGGAIGDGAIVVLPSGDVEKGVLRPRGVSVHR
jgi:hypothetical protein